MFVFLSAFTREFSLSNQTRNISVIQILQIFLFCFRFTETSKINEIFSSASAMKNTPLKLSYVYQCIGCDSFHLQPVGRSLPKVYTYTCESFNTFSIHCIP